MRLEGLTRAQLIEHVEQLQGELGEAQASASAAAPAAAASNGAPPRFVQIASGQPIGQGLVLFALDENGGVWQTVIGRTPWEPLPSPPPGSPAFP